MPKFTHSVTVINYDGSTSLCVLDRGNIQAVLSTYLVGV